MTHIVHFGKYYFPESGGIESVTLSLAKGAAAAGHEVSVVCFTKATMKGTEIMDAVQVIRAPVSTVIASQPLGIRYFFQCLHAGARADVVHLHWPNMLGALGALCCGGSARLLVHWHSDVINKGRLGRLISPLAHRLLRKADRVVVTSQAYARASETLALYLDKVTVVPIGVPDSKHSNDTSALPPWLEERTTGKRIILSVGRLVPYKGFDVLINAARNLVSDAIVIIVGGGPMQRHLDEAVRATGVAEQVILTGRLDNGVLHALFQRAALYCLPSTSRAEACGVVLAEAMAYGLPIVASDIPGSGVPWVNQQDKSGLNVPVGDPAALARACNEILNSTELRDRLARGARERFTSEFTEQQSVNRMLAVYDRLVSTSGIVTK